MQEIIHQRVPGGCHTPEEQVILALETVRNAAHLLEFSAIGELESALVAMQKPLVLLTAAGVLAEMTFSLHDPQGVCGVKAILDPYDIEDFEAVDLSRLRLVANREASGRIEIVCLDRAFAEEITTGANWIPEATDSLECTLVSRNETGNEMEHRQEETHEYDDYETWSESAGEDGHLYDELSAQDRL